jgi:hypothetical protein
MKVSVDLLSLGLVLFCTHLSCISAMMAAFGERVAPGRGGRGRRPVHQPI